MANPADIWLGLSRDEIIALYNQSLQWQSPEGQQEIKSGLRAGEPVPAFEDGMTQDQRAIIQFVMMLARRNNERIQQQLEQMGFKKPD